MCRDIFRRPQLELAFRSYFNHDSGGLSEAVKMPQRSFFFYKKKKIMKYKKKEIENYTIKKL